MTITSAIVLYAVCWFMTLYMILPLFVRNQEEAGEVEPGTSAGAPDNPLMKKRLIWTTVVATAAWGGLFMIITSGWITLDDINRLAGRPE